MRERAVGVWLLVCAALVLAMVALGGYTRLTQSGLSIAEWKPIVGAVPPLSLDAWESEFGRYRATPEYRLRNMQMTLGEFRDIYWVEWAHRTLARIVGLVFVVPLIVFAARGRLRGARAFWMVGLLLLGSFQGVVGWWMVRSGLVDAARVSPYRLAVHLDLALFLCAGLLWRAMSELRRDATAVRIVSTRALRTAAWLTVIVLGATETWGALMAGLHAGHMAPTFPTMNGAWVPAGLRLASTGPLEDPLTVHFLHRLLAGASALTCWGTAWLVKRATRADAPRRLAWLLVALLALQVSLGMITVLAHVPLALALMHQINGALLLMCAIAMLHAITHAS